MPQTSSYSGYYSIDEFLLYLFLQLYVYENVKQCSVNTLKRAKRINLIGLLSMYLHENYRATECNFVK